VHAVVALALPAVEAFDLAIPAQVFGDRRQAGRYRFTVCSPVPGLVASTTGYAVHTEHGLEALAAADTVVVPGCLPLAVARARAICHSCWQPVNPAACGECGQDGHGRSG
jgi:AraC family transcriptional activator FtrA